MIDFDFIPPDFHQAGEVRRATKSRASCVGVLICMMVLWVVVNSHRVSQAEGMLIEVAQQDKQITMNMTKKGHMTQQREVLRDRQRRVDQLSTRTKLVVVLSDISRCLPETVILTDLSVHSPSIREYAPSEDTETRPRSTSNSRRRQTKGAARSFGETTSGRARIIMEGIATEAPEVIEYAAELERSSLFDKVQVNIVGETKWAALVAQRFELTCELVQQRGGTP